MTMSKLQLNYRKKINLENHLKTSWIEVLQQRIQRKSHIKTSRRDRLNKSWPTLANVTQLVGASFLKAKSHKLDSWSGHMPRLQVWPPFWHLWEATDRWFFLLLVFLSLSFSIPFLLSKINKNILGCKDLKKKKADPTPTSGSRELGGDISVVVFPLGRMESQHHTRLPSPEHQCQKEEPPLILCVKISRVSNLVRQRAFGKASILLKGPCRHSLINTYPKAPGK